ncbi:phage GP46 family protein [Novacetimonas hansenii]|uniref:phage GP46 family protein n=1 Tax=Novacetimonas hansenii TaxID=436 RepID=UPI0039EA7EBD
MLARCAWRRCGRSGLRCGARPRHARPNAWWADTYRAQPIGSLLWTLNRSKIANRAQLLQRIRSIATDALQPLQTAGYVKSISVRVGMATNDTAAIGVSLTRPDGSTSQYSWLWQVP